jgi:iron complex transport system substrate-binding protein
MRIITGLSTLTIVLTLLLLMLFACGSPGEDPPPEVSPPAGTPYPLTIIDQAGRTVVIDGPVERIVSGYYISTSMCIALGIADRLAGIEARADTRPIYALAKPELLGLPNVGTARDFNLEACLALAPDLVLLPHRLREAADIMAEMGIPVVLVNPESYEEIIDMMTLVGEATGVPERAARMIACFENSRAELDTHTALISNHPTVYIGGVSSYLSTAPGGMYQSALVEMAGGINVAADIDGRGWVEISYEQLFVMNPEIIVIASEAGYGIEDILLLTELTAVKNNRVYKMPSDIEAWDSPVPSSILGAKWLLSLLHGDIYPMESLRNAAAEFYMEFFGIEVD